MHYNKWALFGNAKISQNREPHIRANQRVQGEEQEATKYHFPQPPYSTKEDNEAQGSYCIEECWKVT